MIKHEGENEQQHLKVNITIVHLRNAFKRAILRVIHLRSPSLVKIALQSMYLKSVCDTLGRKGKKELIPMGAVEVWDALR